MRKKAIWLLAGMFVFSTLTAAAAFPDKEKKAKVSPGIEVIMNKKSILKGKRVGLSHKSNRCQFSINKQHRFASPSPRY